MKRFATLFVALGLATAGSTALAEQTDKQVRTQDAKPQPVQMTDAQLDVVAAGQQEGLINVAVELDNVLNKNNVNVQAPISAAVSVLSSGPTIARQLGALARQNPQ